MKLSRCLYILIAWTKIDVINNASLQTCYQNDSGDFHFNKIFRSVKFLATRKQAENSFNVFMNGLIIFDVVEKLNTPI